MKKYFSYKANFVLLVIVTCLVSTLGVLMKNSSATEQARQALVRSETIQKMNPFKRIVDFKMNEIRNQLVGFAINRKTPKANLEFSNFNAVALLQAGEKEATPKWIESKDATLSRDVQIAALKSLDLQKVDAGGFAWFKYQDASAQPVYLCVTEIEAHRKDLNKKAYLVGMSAQNPLASIADDYRATSGKVYLVNSAATVAAHANKKYDGASFSADPIFQDMKSSKRAMASGAFTDLAGDNIFAYYEKIEKSNLFAVVGSPKITSLASQAIRASLPFIFGMLAFFGFVAFVFTQRLAPPTATVSAVKPLSERNPEQASEKASVKVESAQIEEDFAAQFEQVAALKSDLMKKGLASINPFSQVNSPTPTVVAPITKAENGERNLDFVKQITSGLSRLFSERISSIIAESSLILAKTTDTEVTSHAKLIQVESRKSRDLIRELEQYGLESTQVLSPINFAEVCEHTLARFRNEIEMQEIKLTKELDPDLKVMASIEKLQGAIERIVANAIEALKGREDKTLLVRLAKVATRAELTIADNGVGMNKEVQEKAFLPFFRGFSTANGNGLGLSFVQGVVDTMKGNIHVQSSPGYGTELKISFEAQEADRAIGAVSQKAKYDGLKNPKLDLDFLGDIGDIKQTNLNYFELEESDLDQDFDNHLRRLSDKIISKKKVETPEFNLLQNFEDEDDDIDDFKVVIREPKTKPLV